MGVVTLFGPAVMEVLVPQDIDGMPIDSMHVLPIAFRGSLVATVLFFGPALLLLGVVPPFLVRMGTAGRHAGRTAGVLFAWTTVGGLLGCFLTAPLLVPTLGSRGTLLLSAFGLAGIGLVAMRLGRTKAVRVTAWLLALLVFTYMYTVASTHNPLPFLS